MPPSHHDDEEVPQFPATLDERSGIRLTFGQVWTLVVTIGGAAIFAALAWWGVKTELRDIRRDMWSLADERKSWKELRQHNPTIIVPDVDEIYSSRRNTNNP